MMAPTLVTRGLVDDGVIIGTRLVRAAGEEPDPAAAVSELVRSFAAALNERPDGPRR